MPNPTLKGFYIYNSIRKTKINFSKQIKAFIFRKYLIVECWDRLLIIFANGICTLTLKFGNYKNKLFKKMHVAFKITSNKTFKKTFLYDLIGNRWKNTCRL